MYAPSSVLTYLGSGTSARVYAARHQQEAPLRFACLERAEHGADPRHRVPSDLRDLLVRLAGTKAASREGTSAECCARASRASRPPLSRSGGHRWQDAAIPRPARIWRCPNLGWLNGDRPISVFRSCWRPAVGRTSSQSRFGHRSARVPAPAPPRPTASGTPTTSRRVARYPVPM
jgi:hypothetical protein